MNVCVPWKEWWDMIMDKWIKLGYAESIPKNAKENENCSQKKTELGHSKYENNKAKEVIRGVPKRNEKKRNWVVEEEK